MGGGSETIQEGGNVITWFSPPSKAAAHAAIVGGGCGGERTDDVAGDWSDKPLKNGVMEWRNERCQLHCKVR
jgi:hypothetical protein